MELLLGLILGLGIGAYAFNSKVRDKVNTYLSKSKDKKGKTKNRKGAKERSDDECN